MPPTPPSGSSAAPSPITSTGGPSGPSPSAPLPSQGGGPRLPPNTDGNRVVRKRNRIPLSCAPCRARKLKCNRSTPCENCIKRGDAGQCSYATPVQRRKGNRGAMPLNPDDMQDRINRLEALVLNLVEDQKQQPSGGSVTSASPMSPNAAAARMMMQGTGTQLTPSSTAGTDAIDAGAEMDSESEGLTNSVGVMHIHANKSLYIGNTHWAAVLDDIQEVKNFFVEHKKQYEEQIARVNAANQVNASAVGPSFLLYANPVPNFMDILNQLPVKETCDKLINNYFESYDKLIHVIHPESWRRSYNAHWAQPEQTDPAFLAQVFAMMGISLQAYKKAGIEPPEYKGRIDALSAHYRQLTIQSFALIDYAKPSLQVLEAMILHSRGQAQRAREQDTGIWVLQATIVRIAMRMGLHRDSRHFGHITPFMSEMRRRLWTWIRMTDIILSQSNGLQSMIRSQECDTELPRNLYDEELDENLAELPPSRPSSQFTPITYMIGKATIANILGQIMELILRIDGSSREEVDRLDQELQTAYQQLPNVLHPSDDTFNEQPSTLLMRISIGILYHKSMCVLHRESINKSREDERYRESRRRCIDSALKLLNYQVIIYYEGRPGGRLPGLAHFDMSSSNPDFLLATTIACFDLLKSAQVAHAGRSNDDLVLWGRDRSSEVKEALEASRGVWMELRNFSMEAYKAYEISGVILSKVAALQGHQDPNIALQAYPYQTSSVKNENYTQGHDEEKPEHTAAMTLGMLSTGMGQSSGGAQGPGNYQVTYPTPSSAGQTPGDLAAAAAQAAGYGNPNAIPENGDYTFLGPEGIDWSAWDSFVASHTLEPGHNSMGVEMTQGDQPSAPTSSNGNWQPAQLTSLDDPNLLATQPSELNSNLFANSSMFQH